MRNRLRGSTSHNPTPLSAVLIFAGILDGSFIWAYVGMMILRSFARLMAFLRRFLSTVRSMVVMRVLLRSCQTTCIISHNMATTNTPSLHVPLDSIGSNHSGQEG